MARLRKDFDEAMAAFHRLEVIHQQGTRTPAVAEEFRAKARQLHEDARECRAALAAVRRFLLP